MPEMTWGQMREEAEKQGFTPLPVGTYNAKVDKAEVVPGKNQSLQIKARFIVLDGPVAGKSTYSRLVPFKNDGDVNGMFYQQVGALGFPKDSPIWAQMEQMGFEQGLTYLAQNIIEKPCIIDVDHQPYQGEMRDNIKRIKPYGQGGPVPGGPVSPGAVPQVASPQQQPVASQPVPQPATPAAPSAPVPQAPAPAAQQPQAAPVAPAQPQAPQMPQAAPMAAPQPAQAPETPQVDPQPQEQPQAQPGVPQIPTPPQPVTDTPAPF